MLQSKTFFLNATSGIIYSLITAGRNGPGAVPHLEGDYNENCRTRFTLNHICGQMGETESFEECR